MAKYGDKLRELLQIHGLRYSRPREVILSYFGERAVHVSAEELHHELKRRGENLSLSPVSYVSSAASAAKRCTTPISARTII